MPEEPAEEEEKATDTRFPVSAVQGFEDFLNSLSLIEFLAGCTAFAFLPSVLVIVLTLR